MITMIDTLYSCFFEVCSFDTQSDEDNALPEQPGQLVFKPRPWQRN